MIIKKEVVYVMAYGKITAKQKEILEYIKAEILKKGYPPAVREISAYSCRTEYRGILPYSGRDGSQW